MAYVVPQVLVFQEFNLTPIAGPNALLAHISGAHAYLLRYAEPSEKVLGYLGAYDPFNDVTSAWPGRPPGGLVDESYTKVHIDNARLQYFEKLIGDTSGYLVAPVGNNTVRIDNVAGNLTYGFKANSANLRLPTLGERDVQPGDRVYIRGVSPTDSTNYELDTYVLAIKADSTGGVVGTLAEAGSNAPSQAQTPPVVTPGAPGYALTLAADLDDYSALADGVLNDTYTVTVSFSSVSGDLTTATISVTTASGKDDDRSVQPAPASQRFTVGKRGLGLTFTGTGDLSVGQTFEITVKSTYAKVMPVNAPGSAYNGTLSTTYTIEITRGGKFSTTNPDPTTAPQFSVRTAHGVDGSAPVTIMDETTAYPVGTQGLLVQFPGTHTDGIRLGELFTIVVTAAQDGRMSTLVLGHNLPPELVGTTPAVTDLDLILSVERNVMVDELVELGVPNWEQNATQIIIHSGIVAYDEAFTADGEPQPLPVTSGSVYVEYRAWRSDLASQVGTISDIGTIDDLIPGALSPDNPLKWGVFKALSNSNGSDVKFTAVADPNDLNSWVSVLALLTGRTDVYNLVPLTFDRNVLDLYAAHVDDQSSPENACWRALFGSVQARSQLAVVSDATSADDKIVMAIISPAGPGTLSTQYTMLTVPAGNSDFLTNRVQPGDIARTNYGVDSTGSEIFDEYVIDEVLNENALTLMAGPEVPILAPQKIEIWHHLSRDEVAADLAKQAGSFGDRRVKIVWPDTVGAAGVLMEGFYLAAALAGLRSGVVPQQGLTNVQVVGFDDLSRTTDFLGGAQLNTMAAAGTWIVTQAPDGTVYNRHALTTDNTDVNSSEEMITSNLDSISYTFSTRLAPYIGRMNVTQSALLVLGTEIDATIDFLKSNGYVIRLGGQLVDATVISLQPHAILADRVVCVIDVTLPYPLNNLELHLVV